MRFEPVQTPTAQSGYRGGDLYYWRPNRPNWFITIFVAVWLCGWTVGGIMALRGFLLAGGPIEAKLFLVVWLALWALAWSYTAFLVAWSVAGAESLTANAAALTHGMHVGPWKYERHYKPDAIGNLQWRDGSEHPAFAYARGSKPAAITATYGTKTLQFLRGIQQVEATALLDRLRPALGLRKAEA